LFDKKLLKFLNTQSQVKQVNYPWILDKNDNWIEHKDFYFPVGLLSFVIDCKDRNRIEKMVNSFETIKMGVSYGAKEALAIPSVLFAKPDESNQSIDLVRLSIGEEKAEKVIEDLEKSAESLKGLIAELGERLKSDFKEGVEKINKEFEKYFALNALPLS
jgi:cystathionine beta-lyase/cystathionine gamma-synthase